MTTSDFYYDEINEASDLPNGVSDLNPEDFEHPYVDEEKERRAGFFEEDTCPKQTMTKKQNLHSLHLAMARNLLRVFQQVAGKFAGSELDKKQKNY